MRSALVLGMALAALALACDADAHRLAIGAPAPAYAAPDLEGDTITLASLRGAPVLLNVWATWCHPCQDEMPDLEALHREFAPRGLRLIGVSIDQRRDADDIRRFLDEHDITFTILHDASSTVGHAFRTSGVPETVLIDAQGVLRARWIGQVGAADIRPALEELMPQSGSRNTTT